MFMEIVEGRDKFVRRERGGAHARIETGIETEVHRICTGPYRGLQLGATTGRCEDLGLAWRGVERAWAVRDMPRFSQIVLRDVDRIIQRAPS